MPAMVGIKTSDENKNYEAEVAEWDLTAYEEDFNNPNRNREAHNVTVTGTLKASRWCNRSRRSHSNCCTQGWQGSPKVAEEEKKANTVNENVGIREGSNEKAVDTFLTKSVPAIQIQRAASMVS